MHRWLFAGVFLSAAPVFAADKVAVGPVPVWVKPATIDMATSKSDGAAARFLLQDQQVSFERGRVATFSETIVRLQTPQGLAGGNIQFAWNPDTDVPTVNRLTIRRGDKVLDVLASQTFTVVRREANLENAVLDGVLTATLQPEGLQVGDVLDFALTVVSSDPVLAGHVEQIGGGWNGAAIDRAHLHATWPTAVPLRTRAGNRLPSIKVENVGKQREFDVTLADLQPFAPPNGAPLRFAFGRFVEMSDFDSWADLAALFAPLFAKASALPSSGPLHDEIDRIAAASSDPKTRAEAALALAQDRIRYVALAFNQGALVPADAATTWSRRFGDCKAKTALLLAALHALGVQADAVLVSSAAGDGLDQRLPMVKLFDHVLVRATIAGSTYWLDGTRTGDRQLEQLLVPPFRWGLPLAARGAALVRIMPPPLDRPIESTTIRIDASAGLTVPAPITAEALLRGDAAVGTNLALTNLTPDLRDKTLRDFWRKEYSFVEVSKAEAAFDPGSGELRLTMRGMATMDWKSGWYETDGTGLGWKADFHRDPGQDSTAPFAVAFPGYQQNSETIRLPKGFHIGSAKLPADVNQTIAGVEYRRHLAVSADEVRIDSSWRSIAPEFPAAEAPAAQAALRKLADDRVYLRRPDDYARTAAEAASLLATTPTTADEAVERGDALLDLGQNDAAIAEFDRALAFDPKHVGAHADRAIAYAWRDDVAAANKDLAAVEASDAKNVMLPRVRALLAERRRDFPAALAAYDQAIAAAPNNGFSYYRRAWVRRAMGADDLALQDAAAAIRLTPTAYGPYVLRAGIFQSRSQQTAVAGEVSAFAAARTSDAAGYLGSAQLNLAAHQLKAALSDYDQAVTLNPTYVEALLGRAFVHAQLGDKAGQERDVGLAYATAPSNSAVLYAKASLAIDKDPSTAITLLSAALQKNPRNSDVLLTRAQAYRSVGKLDAALADTDALLQVKPTSVECRLLRANIFRSLNQKDRALAEAAAAVAADPKDAFGWVMAGKVYASYDMQAEAGAAFDRALAIRPEGYIYLNRSQTRDQDDYEGRASDIAAALKLEPDSPDALYEEGRLLDRKGDHAGAIKDYTSGLKSEPSNVELLTARGIAYTRAGDSTAAIADFTATRRAATSGEDFNEACWQKAEAGVALEDALTDCDQALAREPGNASFLDSRGLVLLRLGRNDEAIKVYSAALAKAPGIAYSLYGRALAEARMGQTAAAQSDMVAAKRISPGIAKTFSSYGITS